MWNRPAKILFVLVEGQRAKEEIFGIGGTGNFGKPERVAVIPVPANRRWWKRLPGGGGIRGRWQRRG